MTKKEIITELKAIRKHMPEDTRCTAMMDDLLCKAVVRASRGGGNGNGPPRG